MTMCAVGNHAAWLHRRRLWSDACKRASSLLQAGFYLRSGKGDMRRAMALHSELPSSAESDSVNTHAVATVLCIVDRDTCAMDVATHAGQDVEWERTHRRRR